MSAEPFPNEGDPGISAVEAALGALTPAVGRFDRDRLMFRAGQAAARPRSGRVAWATAAGFALLAIGEAALLAHRPGSRVIERVVVRESTPAPAAPPREIVPKASEPDADPPGGALTLGGAGYERLAAQVLRYGLDGLPAPPPAAGPIADDDNAAGSRPDRPRRLDEMWRALDLGDPS